MMPDESKKILLVDDDVIIAMSEQMELERRGYSVILAHSGEESLDVYQNTPDIDLVLMDIDLGDGPDGTETAEAILKIRELPILFMSSHTEPEIIKKTEKITSYGYIAKNSTTSVIDASIKMAFKLFDAHLKLKKSEKRYETILENRGTATATVDKNGKFIRCNSIFSELLGYSKEELINAKSYREIQDMHFQKTGAPAVFNDHTQFEATLTNRKGEQKFITVNSNELDNEIVISINDITNEKRANLALEASEEYYRSLIENVVDVIALINREGHLTYVTPSQKNVLGYTPSEILGKNVFNYIHKDDLNMITDNFKELLETPGKIIRNSFRFKHKDGNWRYIEGTGKSLVNSPYVKGIVLNYHDITDRIETEKILKESEERYRTLFNNGTELTIISEIKPTGLPGKIIDVNDNVVKYLGYSREELLQMSPLDFAAAPQMKQYLPLAKQFLKSKKITFTTSGYTKTGKPIEVEIKSGIIKFNNKPLMISSVQDITEKKKKETALQKSEKKFRSIINQANIGIALVDSRGIIREWNSYKEKLTGIKYKNAINKPLFEVVKTLNPDQKKRLNKKTQSHILSQISALLPRDNVKKARIIHYKNNDGSVTTVEHSYFAVDIDGEVMYASFDHDITEKIRAEAALKESREQFKSIFNNATIGLYRTNPEGQILMANPALVKMLGYESFDELAACNLNDKNFETNYARKNFIDKVDKDGVVHGFESGWKTKTGQPIFIKESAIAVYDEKESVLYYEGSVEDITKRKKAEKEVSKLLEEKETLLQEVHHRIKNNMNVIQSLLHMQSKKVGSPEAQTILTDAMARVESMQTLYDKLYRSKAYQSVAVKSYLSQLTGEIVQMFSLRDDVRVILDIADFVIKPDIMLPIGIILNELITNSMKYAFEDQSTPCIQLSVSKTNNFVVFKYNDNGPGLTDIETQQMDGFGLKLINTLIRQLNGSYTVDNQNGASITIQIPLVK